MIFIKEIFTDIYHIRFGTTKLMCETMCRFVEHFESPEFKGKVFTLEEFKLWYGQAPYEWDGFNLPSFALDLFEQGKFDPLTEPEKEFLSLFKQRKHSEPFYIVIDAIDSPHGTLDHELAHAFYYLSPGYKVEVDLLLDDEDLSPVNKFLIERGYHSDVFKDEAQAYLMFDRDEMGNVLNRKLEDLGVRLYINFVKFKSLFACALPGGCNEKTS
jgi:hypothetical protein